MTCSRCNDDGVGTSTREPCGGCGLSFDSRELERVEAERDELREQLADARSCLGFLRLPDHVRRLTISHIHREHPHEFYVGHKPENLSFQSRADLEQAREQRGFWKLEYAAAGQPEDEYPEWTHLASATLGGLLASASKEDDEVWR